MLFFKCIFFNLIKKMIIPEKYMTFFSESLINHSIHLLETCWTLNVQKLTVVPSKQKQIFVVCLNRVLLICLSNCLSCSVKRKILQVELSISTISKSECALCVKKWLILSLLYHLFLYHILSYDVYCYQIETIKTIPWFKQIILVKIMFYILKHIPFKYT